MVQARDKSNEVEPSAAELVTTEVRIFDADIVVRSESFGRSLHGSGIRFDRSHRPGRCGQPLRQQPVAAADIENVGLGRNAISMSHG